MESYVAELKDIIRRLHGAEATHVESVPVKKRSKGREFGMGLLKYSI